MRPTTIRSPLDYQRADASLHALQKSGETDSGSTKALIEAIAHYESVTKAFWARAEEPVFESIPPNNRESAA